MVIACGCSTKTQHHPWRLFRYNKDKKSTPQQSMVSNNWQDGRKHNKYMSWMCNQHVKYSPRILIDVSSSNRSLDEYFSWLLCSTAASGDYLIVIMDEYSRFSVVETTRSLAADKIIPIIDTFLPCSHTQSWWKQIMGLLFRVNYGLNSASITMRNIWRLLHFGLKPIHNQRALISLWWNLY